MHFNYNVYLINEELRNENNDTINCIKIYTKYC